MKKGIAVAGTILVDKINSIFSYPDLGELTQIKDIKKAVGGCVPNDAIDLKRIDSSLKVVALGKVGNDDDGNFVIDEFNKNGVITDKIVKSPIPSSFTFVASVVGGNRTFFTYPGSSADFGFSDIDFNSLDVDMLHLGYFLLLDKVDNGDGLKILKEAQKRGIKTSIDLVSENSDRYKTILPCLPYVDNLIINEVEGERLSGISFEKEGVEAICKKLKESGVKDRVIIHMPEKGVCYSDKGYVVVNSFDLPSGFVKGSTGAGDAFCSGALYGIYKEMSDKEILEFSSMCAVASLREADAVSGVVSESKIRELTKGLKRKIL